MALWQIDFNANEKEIKNILETLLKKHDSISYFAALNLGNLYFDKNDFSRSKTYYELACSIKPDNYTAWYNLGIIERSQKNYPTAIEYFQKASENIKNFSDIYKNMAEIYYSQEMITPAIFQYEKLIAITNDRSAIASLADLYYENGPETWNDALMLYKELFQNGSVDEKLVSLANMGNIWFYKTNYTRAFQFYDEALKLSPGDIRLLNNSGLVLTRLQKKEEALENFQKILKIEPDNENALMNVIIINASLNRLQEAVNLCKKVLEIKQDDPIFLQLLATLYLKSRNYEKALEVLDKINYPETSIKIKNDLYRAFIYFKQNRYSDALDIYNRILTLQENHPEALLNKGIVLYHLKRFDEASKELLKLLVLTEDPSLLAMAYLYLGNSAYKKTDYPAAKYYYERGLEYRPDMPELFYNLSLVKKRTS